MALYALVMAVFLGLACWVDLRTRKLPNALTLGCLVSGLMLQAFAPPGQGLLHPSAPGSEGLLQALAAAGLMLASGLLLWRLRLFGAGDAKLLTALAPFAGLKGVLPLLLLTLLAGAVLALVVIVRKRLRRGPTTEEIGTTARAQGVSLPYSLAIAGGALALVVSRQWGLLGG